MNLFFLDSAPDIQVCELDLVFNFHRVYLILEEFVLSGMIMQTSKKAILERLEELDKSPE